MNTARMSVALFVTVAFASSSLAAEYGTMQGRYQGSIRGTGSQGGFAHKFWRGSGDSNNWYVNHVHGGATSQANATVVYTFCTDASILNGTQSTYHMIDTAQAPYQGNDYGATRAKNLNSVMLTLKAMGIVNDRGFLKGVFASSAASSNVTFTIGANTLTSTIANWVQGAQRLIWDALDVNTQSHTSTANMIHRFMTNNTGNQNQDNFANSIYANAANVTRVLGVETSGGNGQDMVTMIPLPPSAYAGMGTLVALLGLGYIRRRKLAAI